MFNDTIDHTYNKSTVKNTRKAQQNVQEEQQNIQKGQQDIEKEPQNSQEEQNKDTIVPHLTSPVIDHDYGQTRAIAPEEDHEGLSNATSEACESLQSDVTSAKTKHTS